MIDQYINIIPFLEDQYLKTIYDKKQIVLHHTVSNPEYSGGDIRYWAGSKERIATSCIIDSKGIINKCFDFKFWAYHLGCGNSWLDKISIAIELDNWGGLIERNGLLYNVYNKIVKVKDSEVVEFNDGFNGFKYFQKYTDQQIEVLGKLLMYLSAEFDISLNYNEDMWSISDRALSGEEGVWTHVSYRLDKSDCFPQFELIEMLKNLS